MNKPSFKNLGHQATHVLVGADASLLERAPNPMKEVCIEGTYTSVRIVGDEFTSLCPATGGPDFGTITIDYEPLDWIVESKSLKYYLESYRNEPIFHEKVVAKICADLVKLLEPREVWVEGDFKARGGWAIKPQCSWSKNNPYA